jgi:2-polyprenyl-3-methyl-5-hydroxy-6-metoxy-1,4-benzoquinol methylase
MHQSLVKAFFDQIAENYTARYQSQQPYHAYLFRERLTEATRGGIFDHKVILDIGAGTGPLYDWLIASGNTFSYYACDISSKMLEQSNIPASNYEALSFEESSYRYKQYDYIFALGLTSYLKPDSLQLYLDVIGQCISPKGQAIISFTNKRGAEWRFYKTIRPLANLLNLNKKLVGQAFRTYAYSPKEISALLPQHLHVQEIRWLSPSIPIISRLFPKTGIPLANKMAGTSTYTDFLAIIERIEGHE